MQLLIATKNKGKLGEIMEVIQDLPIQFLSLADVGLDDEVEEHGTTHEENAILKAQHFFKKTGIPTLGEDSGVYVDAFPNELGVYTRRFRGMERATDDEWITKFLLEMEHVPEKDRGAGFVCVAAIILDEESFKHPHIFRGETRGKITHKLEAPIKPGIPLSSCFLPDSQKLVYAALSREEKNMISHRGKALHAAKEFLKSHHIGV